MGKVLIHSFCHSYIPFPHAEDGNLYHKAFLFRYPQRLVHRREMAECNLL